MFVYDTFCSDDARRRDAWLLEEGEWAHQSLSSNGERLAAVRSSAPVNPLNRGRRNRRQRRRVAALRREEAAAVGADTEGYHTLPVRFHRDTQLSFQPDGDFVILRAVQSPVWLLML